MYIRISVRILRNCKSHSFCDCMLIQKNRRKSVNSAIITKILINNHKSDYLILHTFEFMIHSMEISISESEINKKSLLYHRCDPIDRHPIRTIEFRDRGL